MATKRKPRREKTTGGLYQRADGKWCASVELPSATDGSRRRKVIVRTTQDEALAALRAARRELERTGDLPTASPTVEQWLELWFTRIATPRLKPSTRPTYRSKIDRYIVPAIGRVRLDKLTPAHVRKLHDYITADEPDGRGLSGATALQAHRILAKALTDAVREGRIGRNVAGLVDAPRKANALMTHLDAAQARHLLRHAAEDDPARVAGWGVALLTGMRPGERLGLTRGQVHIDRDPDGRPVGGLIVVSWQLQRLTFDHGCAPSRPAGGAVWPCGRKRGGNCPQRRLPIPADQEHRQLDGGLYLTRPKSRAGWRQIPMAPLLAHLLDAHGVIGMPDERWPDKLVFGSGRPIDPAVDARAWDAALRRAGLPDVSRHSARHTTATLLDELGVPENVRIKILGHSSAGVTAGYTHVADARIVEAMSRLGNLLALDPGAQPGQRPPPA